MTSNVNLVRTVRAVVEDRFAWTMASVCPRNSPLVFRVAAAHLPGSIMENAPSIAVGLPIADPEPLTTANILQRIHRGTAELRSCYTM